MKKAVIFCANGLGELVLNSMDDTQVEVVAFADNDPSKNAGGGSGKELKLSHPMK